MAWTGTRKQYQTDVSDEEWAFAAAYLTLMEEKAPQRMYPLREVFNGLRYLVKGGTPWRLIPHGPAAVGSSVSTDTTLDSSASVRGDGA
jgi:Putative transposase of IS4/5 family (DUF4096)